MVVIFFKTRLHSAKSTMEKARDSRAFFMPLSLEVAVIES